VGAAVYSPEQLGHHRAWGHAPGQRQAVAAVGHDHGVVLAHRRHRADGGGLLPGGQMAVAADARLLVLALGLGLELPDQGHQAEELAQALGRLRARVPVAGRFHDRGVGIDAVCHHV
jgi:hypothetical protein